MISWWSYLSCNFCSPAYVAKRSWDQIIKGILDGDATATAELDPRHSHHHVQGWEAAKKQGSGMTLFLPFENRQLS